MLKTYVQYYLPGFFMSEEEVEEIEKRDVKMALKMMPKGCFAFVFYDVETVVQAGETLTGRAKNHSGRYYPDGEKVHWDKVPDTSENHILRSNLNQGTGYGVKTRIGNWQPWRKGDKIIKTEA